jgi:hypothetical protein
MRHLASLVSASIARWWEKYICAEDPDSREERLRWEAENKAREPEGYGAWAAGNRLATQKKAA